MNPAAKKILSLFASLIIAIPLYIFLHEGGHALTALLCGAKITQFSILEAYTGYNGGVFTPFSLSLFHIAGMLLPVFISIIYMFSYRIKSKNVFYRIFSFMFLIISVGSVLSWVIIPVLYLLNTAPQGDDVTNFLISSGLNPWTVFAGAVALIVCCLCIAWKKRIIQNYWTAVKADS